MKYVTEIWDTICHFFESVLFDGRTESILLACHESNHDQCLDIAKAMRQQFEVPVSVKLSEVGVTGVNTDGTEEVYKVDRNSIVVIMNQSGGLFRGPSFTISRMVAVEGES